jgi:tetratricopeptide (TPR) repeat protein
MRQITKILLSIFLIITALSSQAQGVKKLSKKITIYWDASMSMDSKNLELEVNFLEAYFLKNKNVVVDLVVFSNEIDLQKNFLVTNSNWEALKKTLKNIQYEGIALFDVVVKKSSSDVVFIFTDGVSVLDQLNINKNTRTYILSSNAEVNRGLLVSESEETGGNYIDLTTQNIQKALEVFSKIAQIGIKTISKKKKTPRKEAVAYYKKQTHGTIYDLDGVLVGATIKIKGKKTFALTNIDGEFSIDAKVGETLLISYVGKQVQEILIENREELMIYLANDKNSVLDEVVVKSKITKDDDIVETAYGKIDKKKLGYAVKVIKAEDFNKSAYTLSQAIQGKTGPMRGSSINFKSSPLIIVDGFPLAADRPSQAVKGTDMIDPNNVESVTILKGLAATNRYGTLGNAGVFLITTKAFFSGGVKKNKRINTALLKNNLYTEHTEGITKFSLNKLLYIQEFEKYKTFQEVYSHYLTQREKHLNNPLFFINIAEYIALWGNNKAATKVLTNALEIIKRDVSLLRLVAYKLEEQGSYLLAQKIYEKVAQLKPKESQSYRDLAQIYIKNNEYDKAIRIYKNIYNKKYKGVNFSGLQKINTNELKHLITTKGSEVNTLGLSKNYKLTSAINTRIVIEWNDSDASFELQFVNPQKKFFKWIHTKESDGLRLFNEKKQGFNIEEFLLDDTNRGEWIINIESKLQKNHKTPIAVKYTVFKNYGKLTETSQTKVITLNNLKERQMIDRIDI